MSDRSLRERFGAPASSAPLASRIIAENGPARTHQTGPADRPVAAIRRLPAGLGLNAAAGRPVTEYY